METKQRKIWVCNDCGNELLDQHWSMVFADNIEKELIKSIKGEK